MWLEQVPYSTRKIASFTLHRTPAVLHACYHSSSKKAKHYLSAQLQAPPQKQNKQTIIANQLRYPNHDQQDDKKRRFRAERTWRKELVPKQMRTRKAEQTQQRKCEVRLFVWPSRERSLTRTVELSFLLPLTGSAGC